MANLENPSFGNTLLDNKSSFLRLDDFRIDYDLLDTHRFLKNIVFGLFSELFHIDCLSFYKIGLLAELLRKIDEHILNFHLQHEIVVLKINQIYLAKSNLLEINLNDREIRNKR